MTNPQPLTKEKVIIGRIHEGSAFDSQLPVITEYNVRSAVEGLKADTMNGIDIGFHENNKEYAKGIDDALELTLLAINKWFPVFVDEDKKQ